MTHMKKQVFPWIALSLGLLVMVTLLGAGALRPMEEYGLPLLTMPIGISLLSREGIRASLLITTLACVLLAAGFLLLGLRIWPGELPGF